MDFKAMEKKTAEVMDNPQVGDRFHEMYSFWVYVVWRDGNDLAYMEASPPCTFPTDAKLTRCTVTEFKKRFAYSSIPGYWVHYAGSGHDVSGWVKETTVIEKVPA